jgi:glycosyltransferase involved in cell wall biosynthesis
MKRSIDEPYIQKVLKSGDEKTLLSLNPVDYNDIDDVVNSAKIGIVIYDYYEKYGTSWISLAKGSGKIAHYLRCGKPVICRNLPGFKEIIEKYQCGVMFDDLDEIEVGINLILDNYDFYRKNAYECYKEEYEFSKYFRTVIDFIKK